MNTKILSAFLLTAFLLVVSVSAVSALTFTQGDNTESVTISNTTVLGPNSPASVVINLEDGQTATVSGTAAGQVVTFTASVDYTYADLGKVYSGTANVSNSSGNSQLVTLDIIKSFCSNGSVNDSELELSVDISSDGDEDLEWAPLDTVEIDVELNNNFDQDGDMDMQDVIFEIALFDSTGNDVTDDLLWISEDEDSYEFGDIDEGDDGSWTFEFKVAPELEEDNYVLLVKAYSDGDEDQMCIDYSSDLSSTYAQEVSVTRDNIDDENMIAFEEITLEPSSPSCGQTAYLSAKAYNLGADEQEAVKIKLYGKELGVNKELIVEDFENDDEQIIEFSFDVPKNLSEGTYSLSLWTLYDYDEDEDEDTEDVEFDDSAFEEKTDAEKIMVKVAGSCANSAAASASITAEFSEDTPDAVAGEQVIIIATVKNTGNSTMNYTVEVSGNSAWSTATEIDPKTFTLGANESEEVSIYLDIDDDAEGSKEFTIKVGSTEQKVKITVEAGSAVMSKIWQHLKNNWVIYTIVLVNLILIIAIIVVIAKMVGRSD